MKGLLRGLRYISQIFGEYDKEPQMDIGYPTDVKHVAHIGWDGPSASKPSWMNDFQTATEETPDSNEVITSRSAPSLSADTSQGERQKRRSRRQTNALGSPTNSPNRKSNDGSKHSRRQTTTGIESPVNSSPKNCRRHRPSNNSMDSPSRDPASVRGTSRLQIASGLGAETSARDQPCIPRNSRAKKSKEPSRLKNKISSADLLSSPEYGLEGTESRQVRGKKGYASHLTSVLELYEEEDRVGRQDRSLRFSDVRC